MGCKVYISGYDEKYSRSDNMKEWEGQESVIHTHLQTRIEERIKELKSLVQDDDIVVSIASEDDPRSFLNNYTFTRRPAITVYDNGNFRAQWRNDKGEFIGIQFCGNNQVQYVFFARHGDQDLIRTCGRSNLSDVEKQIEELNLKSLTNV